jgi:hypothetical protein
MAKNCPSCGYRETDNQAQYCNKCGYPFPQNQPARPVAAAAPVTRPAQRTAKRLVQKNARGSGFLSFGTLITDDYLRLIYLIGAVVIVLGSIMGIAGMFSKPAAGGANTSANLSITDTKAIAQDPAGSPLFWIGVLIAGSIVWRMFCELFVVLSRGHGVAHNGGGDAYDDEIADYADAGMAAPGGAGSGQMVECPKCHKIVAAGDLRECEHCGIQGCINCIRSMGLLKKTMTCRECYEGQ